MLARELRRLSVPAPRRHRILLTAAAWLTLGLSLSACGGATPSPPVQRIASPVIHLRGGVSPRIAVIVMENEEYSDIVGSPDAPFINALARHSAVLTRMFAISHPSLPNYLSLTGGSTFGIDDDCTGCSVPGAGLAGQLGARGISWRAYLEGIPAPCWTGDGSDEYAKKHNPFVYFRGFVSDRADCARHDVGLDRLAADERRGLPRFTWITPNLCHDMHDCDPRAGDRFLSTLVPPLLHALGPDGLMVLTFDEGTSDDGCCRLASGGHVAALLAGGLVRPGSRLSSPVDHYSVLQLIEDLLRLPRTGGASCPCTPSLGRLLRRHSTG